MLLLKHHLLRCEMREVVHVGRTTRHALSAHSLTRLCGLSGHTHPSRHLTAREASHRTTCARLHPHHSAGLGDVRLAGTRHARVHHRLSHVLRRVGCHGVTVRHALMHSAGLICGHHLRSCCDCRTSDRVKSTQRSREGARLLADRVGLRRSRVGAIMPSRSTLPAVYRSRSWAWSQAGNA